MSARLIGLDWGTTSCRAYLIGADGAVLQRVADGRIVSFRTFMTGEVFGALKDHTILGRLMRPGADQDGFARRMATIGQ